MPTDLLDLPGYPGHAQARSFADECVRGISEDVLGSDAAMRICSVTKGGSVCSARPETTSPPAKGDLR